MTKTALYVCGHSCSGKSTVTDLLGARMPGAYLVSYDKLKWQLYGYDRNRDRESIRALTLGLFSSACELGLPILLHAPLDSKEAYERYAAIASQHGYALHAIELVAPEDVLIARFRERVANAAEGARMAIRDEETYRERLRKPFYVPPDAKRFDSSVLSAHDIADQILTLL